MNGLYIHLQELIEEAEDFDESQFDNPGGDYFQAAEQEFELFCDEVPVAAIYLRAHELRHNESQKAAVVTLLS